MTMAWKDAIIAVLEEEGKPMHYESITKMIFARGYYETDGLTPERSVSSVLSTFAKKGELFRRVESGIYELIDTSGTASYSPVVLRPCSSYLPSDRKYKQASDFVDSEVLSDLEKELLELIVNFCLPLVTGEVCFADILDDMEKVEFSDEEKSRSRLVDVALLRKKLDELNRQIEEIEREIQNNPQFEELYGVLGRMHSAKEKLEGLLGNANGEKKVKVSVTILGEFDSESKPKPRVFIYYKNIQNSIKSDKSWQVMAGVFVHEMFHAWNYIKAGENPKSVLAIDEPMVEFEALYFLKKLEAFTSSESHPLHDKVSKVRSVMETQVQQKQLSIGDVAAYGFGYYLFEKLSGNDADSIEWIETYSKKSASIDGSDTLVKKVKKALIPVYPFKSENKVMGWFKKIISI